MSKAKKGPAKKAGKKGRGKSPMKPAYMAAKKKAATKSEPAAPKVKKARAPKAATATLTIDDKVKWLLMKAASNGWGTPYDE